MMRRCWGKHQLFPYLTGYCMDQTSDKEQGFLDRLKCLEQNVRELLTLVRRLDTRVAELSEVCLAAADLQSCQDLVGLAGSMDDSEQEDSEQEN